MSGSQILQDKGAIVSIDNPGPGFYWRLIIDLSRLNRFLQVPHQDGNHQAIILLGDWTVSLDLQDAYRHIPVHPDYQHYLRYYFEGRVYQFKAMPFGLMASPPLIFQSIIKVFVAPLLPR
jgi:hypothetical protein